MKTRPDGMTIEEAIYAAPGEPAENILDWQMEQLQQRHKEADEGKFASPDAVKAVIRKFVPNG